MRVDMEGRIVVRKYAVKAIEDGTYQYNMPVGNGPRRRLVQKDLDEATLFDSVEDAGACEGLTKVVPVLVWDE